MFIFNFRRRLEGDYEENIIYEIRKIKKLFDSTKKIQLFQIIDTDAKRKLKL